MPWTASQAKRHTRKASTPKKAQKWARVANAVLRQTGNEGMAVRTANAAMNRKTRTQRR